MRLTRLSADTLLLSVALVWGGTFIVVRDAVRVIPPMSLVGVRFLLAFLALALIFPRSIRRWRRDLLPGLSLAALLFGGFITQTLGLTRTTAANSGFITGLNVVFVALLAAACGIQRLNRRTLAGTALAAVGMAVLAWQPGGWRMGAGDLLTLACAVFFAAHIVATGILAPGRDPVSLAGIQFFTVALAGLAWHALTEGGPFPAAGRGWLALLYLGLGGTGFAFLVQTAAQRRTSAVDTAVIFSTEPLFAAAFAVLWGGERLSLQMVLGGSAIFAAMLLAVLASEGKQAGNQIRGETTNTM